MKRSKNKNRSGKAVQTPEAQNVETKKRANPLVVIAVAVVVVATALVLLLNWIDYIRVPNDIHAKDNYTVSDAQAVKAADVVIGKVGDRTLTNSEFQMYYYMAVNEFVNYYGEYAESYGLDINAPLENQKYPGETGLTWQQYFMDYAMDVWYYYQVMEIAAEQSGYQITEGLAGYLAGLEAEMNERAQKYGYNSGIEMLQADIGANCTMEDYIKYLTVYCVGLEYYEHLAAVTVPTDAEIEAHYAANEADYVKDGVTKDSMFVDVRHVMIYPATSATDESGNPVSTDADWEACRIKAEAVMAQWLDNGGTEEYFLQLVELYSEDVNSNTVGGLYENVFDGEFTTEFNEWCFDASRQVGDQGLIRTKFGYHLMYYVGSDVRWYETVRADLAEDMLALVVQELQEKYPMEMNFREISLADVIHAD